jgi:hypothetical protein
VSVLGLRNIAVRQKVKADALEREVDKAKLILEGANPKQVPLILDESPYLGARCPRRSGKTYAVTSKALYLGEAKPGSRILIISLTLKSTVENYWSGAPGGLWSQNSRYELGLKFNTTAHTWVHPNGSRGMLAGAETKADIERLRGAAAEADLVILDECKSFAPNHLDDLIENVIEPGLMTRNGQLLMVGTPGSIPLGQFYAATCLLSRLSAPTTEDPQRSIPTCIPWDERKEPGSAYRGMSEDELNDLFSLHEWTIEDNTAVPGQWLRALSIKRRRGYDDNHPVWRREYLGQWVSDASDLVYSFARMRAEQKCTWQPDLGANALTGLEEKDGPWHMLLGLDLGFVDDSAMVLVAYSETLCELRHIYDFKAPGLDAQSFAEEVLGIIDTYGQPEMIVADVGGGGSKMIVEMLNQRYGLAIQPASKREKQDHIELINGDFVANRIKIIPNSDLDHELCGLQWDLSNDSKVILSRTGRLREDPSCPNHLCDALLYVWRFSYHYYAAPREQGPESGSVAWWKLKEHEEYERAIMRRRAGRDPHRFRAVAEDRTALGDFARTGLGAPARPLGAPVRV